MKKLPVSIDELLIDIFYHFKHSAKRWHEFNEIQEEFSNIKPLRVLKHCTTRWLSLEQCVKRLIEQWPALHCYFDQLTGTDRTERSVRVTKQLKDSLVKLFCHFALYALKPLNKFSTALQTHASKIGTLQHDVCELLRAFLSNFINPDILQSTEDVTTIAFTDRSIQLSNDELGIGTSTRLLLCGELEDEIVGTVKENTFFNSVRTFYETSVSKMLAKFPFDDSTIKELAFLDPRNRNKSSLGGLTQLATRFTSFTSDEIDSLCMEFRDFRATSNTHLPTFDPKNDNAAVDHFWAAMSDVRSVADSEMYRFQYLSQLAKTLLVLPHSNADPERLFSMVRKVETEERRNLDATTVQDLLAVKINNDKPCYMSKTLIDKDMLTSARSATMKHLNKI